VDKSYAEYTYQEKRESKILTADLKEKEVIRSHENITIKSLVQIVKVGMTKNNLRFSMDYTKGQREIYASDGDDGYSQAITSCTNTSNSVL